MCCLCVKNVRTSVCTCAFVYARVCEYAYMCVFCGMYVTLRVCMCVFSCEY